MFTQSAQQRSSVTLFTDPESFNLSETLGTRIYSVQLCRVAGSMTAGIFLSRATSYWINNSRKPYWKMNTPDGDPERSWTEQEGFTYDELKNARNRVGTRVKKSEVAEMSIITPDMLNHLIDVRTRRVKGEQIAYEVSRGYRGLSRCVLYWRNGSGRIWYRINEALIAALLTKDADPTRDNIDILREVKQHYPNAVIQGIDDEGGTQAHPIAPEPPPAPKKTIQMKPVEAAPVTPTKPASSREMAAPPPKQPAVVNAKPSTQKAVAPVAPPPPKPPAEAVGESAPKKPNPYKLAIAYAYGWFKTDNSPNPDAPLIGQILSQFVGNAKSGKRAEYKIGDFTAEMILGMFLWYRAKNKRIGNDKLQYLPQTAETLKERADEFLSIMEVERVQYIKQGEALLATLMGNNPTAASSVASKPQPFDFDAANKASNARRRAERDQRITLDFTPSIGDPRA